MVLTDSLPAGVALVSATASAGTCTGGTPVTCTLGTLAAQQPPVTALVTVRVLPTASGSLLDTAAVTSGTSDPVDANNTATARTSVVAQADLSLTKAVSPAQATVGQALSYALVVTNKGPAAATNVTVTDPLPGAVKPEGATASQGGCAIAAQVVTCTLGDLAPNGTATLTIETTRTGENAFSNTATVTATEPDPNPGDDSATVATPGTTPEDCGNCQDDDGNGLVDAEDPACCTAQTLVVTHARFRSGKGRLRVRATLPPAGFAGLDPRHQDVRLQIRSDAGEVVCCTIGTDLWQRLFRQTFGFFDQKRTLCPPIKGLSLALPSKGQPRATIVAGRVEPGSALLSPLEITLRAADQCAAGPLTLRPTAHGGAVFP